MKPKINISLNPWYFCNFRCGFCYLTEDQLGDRTKLSLDALRQRIDEIAEHYTIEHVDIYGGEVLLLPKEYLKEMKDILQSRGITDLVLVTNLSMVNEIALDTDYDLSVSFDFGAREKHDQVLSNMFLLTRPFNVLSLAGRVFLDTVTVDEYVSTMNMMSNLMCAEIKPYSSNQANDDDVKFTEYEDFVWGVINHPERQFEFENLHQIQDVVEDKVRNAYSDDHIYITPTGDLAVLDFDQDDRELFLVVDGIAGYQQWCVEEKQRVDVNPHCGGCPYKGGCLSEHLREVKSVEDSCNGFRNLLDRWAES
jgi:organic radical activating enzyme